MCISQCNVRAMVVNTKFVISKRKENSAIFALMRRSQSRNLQADSLLYLIKALILASVRPKDKEGAPYDEKVRFPDLAYPRCSSMLLPPPPAVHILP